MSLVSKVIRIVLLVTPGSENMQDFFRSQGARSKGTIVALCVWLLLVGAYANAQVTGQGTISGTVTDSSDAVIVGAQVTVTNSATNVSNNVVTNSTGYFEVDNLNPGVYKISVSAPGFEKLLQQGITLDADARLNVPMKLNPGSSHGDSYRYRRCRSCSILRALPLGRC